MTLLISPTEPPAIKSLGTSSSIPEKYGVDIFHQDLNAGIQRKEVKDMIASLRDGRVSKELLQMSDLDYAMWIIEGKVHWTNEGVMVYRYGNITKRSWEALQWSLQSRGHFLAHSHDKRETVDIARNWFRWIEKPDHNGLVGRKGKIKGESKWGVVTKKDHQVHLLTSINGIGPGVARKIVGEVGLPFILDSEKTKRISQIKGIGKGRVEMIERLFK